MLLHKKKSQKYEFLHFLDSRKTLRKKFKNRFISSLNSVFRYFPTFENNKYIIHVKRRKALSNQQVFPKPKKGQELRQIHRCTRVENPGEGVRDVFAKIPRGGQGFREKLPGGVHLF
jgi:hypothetical protein